MFFEKYTAKTITEARAQREQTNVVVLFAQSNTRAPAPQPPVTYFDCPTESFVLLASSHIFEGERTDLYLD